MQKIGTFWFVIMVSILYINCGSECTNYSGSYYPNAQKLSFTISLDRNISSNDSINYELIEPKIAYYTTNKWTFPLLINYDKMVFEVKKQNTVIDSIIILYNITPKLVKLNSCEEADYKYKPNGMITSCKSTGHYLNIIAYSSVN